MNNATAGAGRTKQNKTSRMFLLISVCVFLVFAANVVVGKVAFSNGATSSPGFSDVGEFLTLFVSVVFFICACLAREKTNAGENDPQ